MIAPHHYIATIQQPLPPVQRGITWVHAGNGVFKRGISDVLDLMVQYSATSRAIPGMPNLLPYARWQPGGKIPGALLQAMLGHARSAGATSGSVLIPTEQQYFILWHEGKYRWYIPPQNASSTRVGYQYPHGAMVLVDIHSHHQMRAYFSSVDDQDDMGLSISCVMGSLFTQPELTCRLNVYGVRQVVPASIFFDHLGGFHEHADY
jgi:PRTRC genetic system protein A